MSSNEHGAAVAEVHQNGVAARIQQKLATQEKVLTGAFMFSLVVGGIATLALIVTWMGNAAH